MLNRNENLIIAFSIIGIYSILIVFYFYRLINKKLKYLETPKGDDL